VSLYWFGTPESNTLRPVVGVECLRIRWIRPIHKGSLRPPYIGLRMRSVPRLLIGTTRRPKSTLHILPYPIDLLWAKSTKVFVSYAKS
jgi:hypothetical protein